MKYTSERNHQILLELLKRNGIKKIVTSPGGTNVTFVASVQRDPFLNYIHQLMKDQQRI